MKSSLLLPTAAIAVVGICTQIPAATAFTTVTSSTSNHSTQLYSVEDMRQRIKKAGGGITTIAPGDLKVYDPNQQGKLQGTGDLEARVSAGASFPGETSSSVADESPIVTSEAPEPSATSGESKPSTRPGGFNLTNLLNSERPRRDAYSGKSQC
eukprot:CAMPEP_0201694692 /NCGR_PEP_ID=MMETSP0578-20130828/6862_1 /ASSEMBLY_ACC=CAM_ASM_000663 /TAXON_ID=267565 /ORGANISM="Skeletonema grethea, Strain CCMP 1804" /LENGTH=153 /DNA_ID=CAMNT_0048180399 /DNA_START=142 /DNA_END=603 /DNA_ORIENTATION=+